MQEVPVKEIKQILLEARSNHGKEPLARLEAAFIRSVRKVRVQSHHPMQNALLLLPELSVRPWLEPRELEGAAALEDSWQMISEEIFDNGNAGFQDYDVGPKSAKGWQALGLIDGCRPVEKNRGLCPKTVALVSSLPRVGEMCVVSALAPGGVIKAHCGPSNLRITVHLGLKVPADCVLRVAGEARTVAEGKCLAFDDSFEHEAWNHGKFTRFVLLVDFWHPDLTDLEIAVLEDIVALISTRHSAFAERKESLPQEKWWR